MSRLTLSQPSDPRVTALAAQELSKIPITQGVSITFPRTWLEHNGEIWDTIQTQRNYNDQQNKKQKSTSNSNWITQFLASTGKGIADLEKYFGRLTSGSYSDFRLMLGVRSSFIKLEDGDVSKVTSFRPMSAYSSDHDALLATTASEFIVMHEIGHTILFTYMGRLYEKEEPFLITIK